MSSTASHSDRTTERPMVAAGSARADRLRAGNINPRTGLATDYLNHFNEAVMLLEMIPDMPICAEDFLAWSPMSYAEHFTASNFKARDLAIEAYEAAHPSVREPFDQLTKTMTEILLAVSVAMREASQDSTRAKLAEQATNWVKPLVMQAGGVINGEAEIVPDTNGSDVDEVDAIMAGF